MNPAMAADAWLLPAVLAAIAAVSALRAAMHARRRGDATWRIVLLVLAPFVLAAALWRFLAPPPVPAEPVRLVVATAGTPAGTAAAAGDLLVALPEAPPLAGAERVPDLATALRRHPQARALHVLGVGLPARDHDAARARPLSFEPAPRPRGIVALAPPAAPVAGRRWQVHGRIAGDAGEAVELLDPAGVVVDRQRLAADGGFALAGTAGPPGEATWTLRHRAASGDVVADVPLPLRIAAGAPLRLWLLGGGVNAEAKMLRRWAADAGLEVAAQADVGGGVAVGIAPAPTRERLDALDVLVLDERRWRALGPAGRERLRTAVRDGLGVLLRLGADPDAGERAVLRDWGFRVEAADVAREFVLPGTETADAPAAADATGGMAEAAADPPPSLTRRPLRLSADAGVPLLRSGDGEALASWRAEGRGRVGVWLVADTFRLPYAGRRRAYGELWAATFATLARAPAGVAAPAWTPGRVGERGVLCGLSAGAAVRAPGGEPLPLRIDPAAGDGCAAAWPVHAGVHEVRRAADAAPAPWRVLAADELPGLRSEAMREATAALAAAATGSPTGATASPPLRPGDRRAAGGILLLLAAAAWAFERARAGRGAG